MINLSLDELKLIARNRNIRDQENKSEKDLIKALSEPKPKIKIEKKKLEEIRKNFSELRQKFSKKEIYKYRKTFYDIKNYRYLSESEIKKAGKNLTKLKRSLRFKKFNVGVDAVDYDNLDNYDYNYDFADGDKFMKKLMGSIRRLFKGFGRDYYKPIRTDSGFAGRNNNNIEDTSRGDRYENLSPEKYLDIIRPYLRDLINDHKPTAKLNNDRDAEHGEWKIQLVMLNNCISVKIFEDTRTIYSKSDPAEIVMGSDTNDVIDRLFDTTLERFQQAIVTSNKRGSEFSHESVALMYYYFQKIDIKTAESYVKSPDWIANKRATINSKNEKDNKCFKWSTTSGLNYNKIKRKYFRHIEKFKWVYADISSHQRHTENYEQNNTLVALNVLFVSHDSEEIKLARKSKYNYKRKN